MILCVVLFSNYNKHLYSQLLVYVHLMVPGIAVITNNSMKLYHFFKIQQITFFNLLQCTDKIFYDTNGLYNNTLYCRKFSKMLKLYHIILKCIVLHV